jgi:pyruvate-ferredoxin/flavodoxin oxidoreductase
MHFFDGFRTSHEVNKIETLSDDDLRAMIDEERSRPPRRGADADRPVLRGTAQNPDVFFQAREACNPFYDACPGSSQRDGPLRQADGPPYHLFDYVGAPDAERVIVLMGSGAETAARPVET